MKFTIFIADVIRQGQYPRVDHFEYAKQYDKYIYLGRELSVEEFNAAAKLVFCPNFRNQGFSFCPMAIEPVEECSATDAPPADTAPNESDPSDSDSDAPPVFRLDGRKVFNGETHVAGLYGDDNQLRVLSAHAALRPAIEAWLSTSNQ